MYKLYIKSSLFLIDMESFILEGLLISVQFLDALPPKKQSSLSNWFGFSPLESCFSQIFVYSKCVPKSKCFGMEVGEK